MSDDSSVDSRQQHEAETLAPPDKQSRSSTHVEMQETLAPHGAAPRPTGPGPAEVTDVQQFCDCLSLSGLFTADELKKYINTLLTNETPKNVQTLADALIKNKKLTQYQADLLRHGQTRGLVFGNYVVLDKLGEGGMGVVFKAHHRRMKRTVALKVLPAALTNSQDALARFHREVEAAAKLTHPNIAAAYDADEAGGVHFLVMEYVDGLNLSQFVRQNGPVPVGRAVYFMTQAARGLDHAHQRGVIHRDIKPGNLLVDKTGAVKILDMGLARFDTQQNEGDPQLTELTQSGRVMGTVDYMAPEQALDAKHADHRADIYSLGCTLFFLLTGRPMSPEGTLTQKLMWHQTAEIPSLIEACPGIAPRLEQLFKRMLARRPDDRVQSMGEVVGELDGILRELSPAEADLAMPAGAVDHYFEATVDLAKRKEPTVVDRRTLTGANLTMTPTDSRSKHRRVGWIAGTVTALIAAGVAAVFLLPSRTSGKADVVFQMEEPGAEVLLDGICIRPAGGTDDTSFKYVVDAGKKYKVEVKKDGFEPLVADFEPRADQPNLVALGPLRRVRAGQAVAPPPVVATASTGLPPAGVPTQPAEPDKGQFLRWVFTQGGSVVLLTGQGDATGELHRATEVPAGKFTIRTVKLDKAGLNDAELARLGEVTTLQNLSLKENAITDAGLANLAKLTGLWSLDLSETKVTDAGLERLSTLTELRDLNLQKLPISNAGLVALGKLPKLEYLYLSDTKVTDEGLPNLVPLENLKQVSLNGTTVTLAGVDGLRAAFPKVKVQWDIPDTDRDVARRLLALGGGLQLSIGEGPVTVTIRKLSDMPGERFLIHGVDLSGRPQVTDAEVAMLTGLGKLENVQLDGTGVSDEGLARLGGIKSLRILDLGGLQVTEAAVNALKGALPGCEVRWSPNSERVTAEWVLAQHGSVTVATPDGEVVPDILDSKGLPAGRFSLRQVHLDNNAAVGDADLVRFKGLTALEAMFLNGTQVGDAGVSELAGCVGLRDLGLNQTKISNAGLAALSQLTSLRQLFLAGTAINDAGLEQLKMLRQLTHLSLARTGITDSGLVQLARLGNLSWLCLSDTPLTDGSLPQLSKLASLRELLVDGTQITDAGQEELAAALPSCKVQGNVPDAQRLAARWVLTQGGAVATDAGDIRKLAELPRTACVIKKVDLQQLAKVNNDGLVNLAPCTAIEELDLSQTAINDEGLKNLAGMTELTRLSLGGTRISDTGLTQLKNLNKLKSLNLQGTRVTLGNFKDFSNWIGLEELQLDTTKLNDRSLANLAPFTSLVSVNLSDNPTVSDKGVAQLAGLTKLQTLGLRGTMVGDAAMPQIAKLANLRALDLSSTSVTDAGASQVRGLKQLRFLYLYGTAITDSTLGALADVKTLQTLNVAKTKVTDGAAATFKAAVPNCRLVKSEKRTDENDPNAPQTDGGGGRLRPFGGG